MTPEELARGIIEAHIGFTFDRHDLADKIAVTIREAIEEDRRTRPVLPGVPMSEASLKEARVVLEHVRLTKKLALASGGAGDQPAHVNYREALVDAGTWLEPLLDHLTHLEALLHDAQQESGYHTGYDRGKAEGREWAAQQVEQVGDIMSRQRFARLLREGPGAPISGRETVA